MQDEYNGVTKRSGVYGWKWERQAIQRDALADGGGGREKIGLDQLSGAFLIFAGGAIVAGVALGIEVSQGSKFGFFKITYAYRKMLMKT